MRLCLLCVPRGRCLKCVCGAAWEGAESNQWMQDVWEGACTEEAESNQRMQDVWEGACTEEAESNQRMQDVWEGACTEEAESNQRMQDVWEGACTEGAESYLRMRGGLGGGVSHFSSSEFGPGFSGLPSSCSVCVCVSEQRQTKHVNAKHWNFSITNR